jgi:exosome complex exonuclease RRP6
MLTKSQAAAAAAAKTARQKTFGTSRDRHIEKPQLLFDHPPTNDERGPFKPLLESKPHASVSLGTEPIASDDDDSKLAYPHPYQLEIEQYRYPSSVYTHSEPIPYHPFETTTATFVDTEEALAEMLEELKQAQEIAIDLEHHDNRSYIGIVSLMQISTRDKDWIVDTLKPWRRKLQCLNEVFADPSIVKVLHGAFMDAIWLQRDLGLYLVGLFDTHYACRALGYAGGSLAFLLKKFADVDAQKQHQMADWRVRPLPTELFDYARSDTHYLLYIFDCMRNELIERSDFSKPDHEGDKLWDVLQKSTEVALQRYEHPQYDAELGQGAMGWYRLLSRTPALFSREQFAVFKAVHQWRDTVAREQDDSVHFVMPNHQIFSLAKAMPSTRLALMGVAQPTTQTVRLRADELLNVIVRAQEAGKNGPDMMETLSRVEPQLPTRTIAAQKALAAQASAEQQNRATKIVPPASTIPIRTPSSTFWGNAFESSAWDRPSSTTPTNGITLSVPLPPLTAEIFADPADILASTTTEDVESSPAQLPPQPEEEPEDSTFVLKDLSRKRKRAEAAQEPQDNMAAQSDEVTLDFSEEASRAQSKAERKAAKKAAKRAAKQSGDIENGQVEEAGGAEEEEAFDYASAPSLLNPPRENLSKRDRKKKQKQVNPYAKSLDAAKGMPRTQKEKAGKSMTFRK